MKEEFVHLCARLLLGLSIRCQIVIENLECVLSLPVKYRERIEGLIGNFDGDSTNDLVNRNTNQTVSISASISSSSSAADENILNACRSCEFHSPSNSQRIQSNGAFFVGIADNTTQSTAVRAILPSELYRWYYTGNNSRILEDLNPILSQANVNGTCSNNLECIHDMIIRANPITSGSTRVLLGDVETKTIVLSEINTRSRVFHDSSVDSFE